MAGHPQEKQPGRQTYSQSERQIYSQPKRQAYSQPERQAYSQPGRQIYSQPGGQIYSQPGEQTYSQPDIQTYSQPGIQPYAQQQTPKPKRLLPMHFHQMIYMISMAVLVLGVISIIFGGASFAIPFYSITADIGVNIWAGIMYLIAGGLGIAIIRRYPENIRLIYTFYGFCIIFLLVSIAQLVISSIGIARRLGIITGAVGIVISIFGISLSLTLIAFLYSSHLCGGNAESNQCNATAVPAVPGPSMTHKTNNAV